MLAINRARRGFRSRAGSGARPAPGLGFPSGCVERRGDQSGCVQRKTAAAGPSAAPLSAILAGRAMCAVRREHLGRITMSESTSFMRRLCMGEINEDAVLPFPSISQGEKETLETVISSLGQMLESHAKDFVEWDRKGEFPPEFIAELKEFGLFGLVIPAQFGGLGLGSAAYSRTLQEIAKYDASAAVTVGAHSSIGMRGLLLFGTDEQKARYMPKLATGEMIAAFCLTEPGSGSDAASIKT